MNSCDFCKMMWQTVLAIGGIVGSFAGMQGLNNMGKNNATDILCFEARLEHATLRGCREWEEEHK